MNGRASFLNYLFVGAIVMALAGSCVGESRGLHLRMKRARNRIQTALKRGVAMFKKILLITVLCVVIFISLALLYNYGDTVRGALWASEAAPVLLESVRSDPLAWLDAADGFEVKGDATVRGLVQAAADAVGDPRLAQLSDKLYGRDTEDPEPRGADGGSEPQVEILVGSHAEPRQKQQKQQQEKQQEKRKGKRKEKQQEKQGKKRGKEKMNRGENQEKGKKQEGKQQGKEKQEEGKNQKQEGEKQKRKQGEKQQQGKEKQQQEEGENQQDEGKPKKKKRRDAREMMAKRAE